MAGLPGSPPAAQVTTGLRAGRDAAGAGAAGGAGAGQTGGMAACPPGLAGAIAGYARLLHGAAGAGRHHVASPLAAWLLLALAAPAVRAGRDDELTAALGCAAPEAAAAASALLASPHPLVAAAVAAWGRPRGGGREWLARLPPEVETGDIPTQEAADAWARRHTLGLIDSFPVGAGPGLALLLASALAAKVSWDCPFEVAPASALGPASPWAARLTRVLRSPQHPAHAAFIAATPEAGDVAVHAGTARGGLMVVSVIADPGVRPGDVIAAAHRVALARAAGEPAGERPLSGLPPGDGPAWTVRDETSPQGPGERWVALLPAWSARSTLDLARPGLGFAAVARALGAGDPWRARQAVTARYDRVGFEAGAVTAMGVLLSMAGPRRGRLRTAELRFGHPYAVVAVATGPGGTGRSRHAGPWHGLPVFSAWITEPGDAEAAGR